MALSRTGGETLKDVNELIDQEDEQDFKGSTIGLWIFLSVGLVCFTATINQLIYIYYVL